MTTRVSLTILVLLAWVSVAWGASWSWYNVTRLQSSDCMAPVQYGGGFFTVSTGDPTCPIMLSDNGFVWKSKNLTSFSVLQWSEGLGMWLAVSQDAWSDPAYFTYSAYLAQPSYKWASKKINAALPQAMFLGAAYGQGTLVLTQQQYGAGSGEGWCSVQLANWQNLTWSTTSNVYTSGVILCNTGLRFVENRFYLFNMATDPGVVQWSVDGVYWINTATTLPEATTQFNPLLYAKGRWFFIGNPLMTSTDGDNWNSAGLYDIVSVVSTGTMFTAASADGLLYSSSDGQTWKMYTQIPLYDGTKVNSLAYGDGNLVATVYNSDTEETDLIVAAYQGP